MECRDAPFPARKTHIFIQALGKSTAFLADEIGVQENRWAGSEHRSSFGHIEM